LIGWQAKAPAPPGTFRRDSVLDSHFWLQEDIKHEK